MPPACCACNFERGYWQNVERTEFMFVLRTAVRLHKWLAILIGLQVFLWLLGGLVMSALPIERVRGEHKIADHSLPVYETQALLSLSQAAQSAGLTSVNHASLSTLLDEPVWQIQSGQVRTVVSARDGEIRSPITEDLARQIADHDFLPEADILSVERLDNPPSEYSRGGPVWQVAFDDPGDTRIYIDPQTGEIRARRSSTWRLFDFFWRLHVMDYDDGADFNHPLLIGAALLGVMFALAGLIILFFRIRRSLMLFRGARKT